MPPEVFSQGGVIVSVELDKLVPNSVAMLLCQRARKKGTNFGAIGGHQGAMASDRR